MPKLLTRETGVGETHSGQITVTRATTTDVVLATSATGDAAGRFYVDADGALSWGDGTNPVDTTLYRSAAGTLATGTAFNARNLGVSGASSIDQLARIGGAAVHPGTGGTIRGVNCDYLAPTTATSAAYGGSFNLSTVDSTFTISNMYSMRLTMSKGASATATNAYGLLISAITAGTSSYGAAIEAATTQTLWISSNADNTATSAGLAFGLSRDTNLYRSAANTLKTDDALVVAGAVTGSGYDLVMPAKALDATNEPNGFESRTTSTIALVDAGTTYTFTIAPTGANFNVWIQGALQVKTSESLTITKTTGAKFVYYNSTGTLTQAVDPWTIGTDTPIALIYYSATTGAALVCEERHGAIMDGTTHQYLHTSRGAQLASGLALGDYRVQQAIPVNSDNRWSLTSGSIMDEDITHALPGLAAGGPYTVMRRTGTTEWTWTFEADPFITTGGYIAYNLNTAGTWSQAGVSNNNFCNYWLFAWGTTSAATQTFVVQGQNTYTTLAAAQAATIESNLDVSLYPFIECVARYQITMRAGNSYGTTGHARIEAVTQLVGRSIAVSSQLAASNHATLSNRSLADQHPAAAITNTPAGYVAATDVQTAINELDTEKLHVVRLAASDQVIGSPPYATASAAALATPPDAIVVLGGTNSQPHSYGDGNVQTISGGYDNHIADTCPAATISGGAHHNVTAGHATVGGGSTNTTASSYGVIAAGLSNTQHIGSYSVIGGGRSNVTGVSADDTKSDATVAGGYSNTASGLQSTVGGGRSNTASGLSSTVAGGLSSTASGDYSAAVGGQSAVASSNHAVAGGNSSTASGSYSVAFGDNCTASGAGGVALGKRAISALDGCFTFANQQFAAIGDAQTSWLVAKRTTTTGAVGTVGLSGATGSGPVTIPDLTTWMFRVMVVGRRTDAAENDAWEITGCITRASGAATTAIVGTNSTLHLGSTIWAAIVDADTTNGALRVRVTGEAAKTIKWVARIETAEVTG